MSMDVSAQAMPRCAVHPEALAGATCSRCGSFLCAGCTTWRDGSLFCATCAQRPEINYLEQFRQTLWGRRDGWAYIIAGCTALMLVAGALSASESGWLGAIVAIAFVPVGVGFFLGQSWARLALVVAPLLGAAAMSREFGPGLIALGIIPTVAAFGIIRDPRNQLFFRRPIPTRALHRLWDLHANNPLARHAFGLGLNALFIPLFAPIAIVCGAIALTRVDSRAQPPIGRRGQALAAILLGVASLAGWAFIISKVFLWPTEGD
ncbi:hypothetical protein KRR26_16485 [Corallococcus sp. M34]|uniref:hypothetical protein n=1 Tax=Citreicoccus inhibens TaxID=2849499 RepID=UPI001C232E86|nr:hypothetical protein [Citreicoccus inhibens]MBU8897214.1 hypothetical protein [Citreicoccus inhibens]